MREYVFFCKRPRLRHPSRWSQPGHFCDCSECTKTIAVNADSEKAARLQLNAWNQKHVTGVSIGQPHGWKSV